MNSDQNNCHKYLTKKYIGIDAFKKGLVPLFFLFAFFTVQSLLAFQQNNPLNNLSPKTPIKIACVGNSITYGSTIVNRQKNAFPKQLEAMLGNDYKVMNFGVSGRTLLKKGDYPYWNTQEFMDAKNFDPDILFIKLGTNDSKLQNRIHLDEFNKDYKEMIRSFKENNENLRVVLLLPLPSFADDSTGIWNPIIKDKIIPLTLQVAFETGSEVIDLYQLFVNQENLIPDKIHPSSLGATVIAKRLYEVVKLESDNSFNILQEAKIQQFKISNFHGFQLFDFDYKGVSCKIVKPKKVNKNHNWVWRARFWGHEPQTDIALLERGFHIVYCDVANLFGSDEAVKRWNNFYQLMAKAGLSKKVALEGMSRGGFIVYNWAVENPDKVVCVYADAPVLDGKSWPGGMGEGKGSSSDWKKFKEQYNLDSQELIDNFKGNPIHKTKEIVKAGFPILHVCGEADQVVPVDENTRLFETQIKDEGGNINVIYKKGIGHHPHSLKNPTPIVDFILRATNNKINFAVIPSPGSEYRSAAGWKKGKGWWYQKNEIDSLCSVSDNIDLLLIGNSITQGWGGNRTLVTYKPGLKAAHKYFKDLQWIGAGISGDRTEHVAFRIEQGDYSKANPKFVALAIGVNNFPYNTAKEIAEGIKKDIEFIKQNIPNASILLFGPLPTGLQKDSDRREKYNKIHKNIAAFAYDESIKYFNLIDLFSDKNGNLDKTYYGGDGIHINPEGYEVWAKFIKDQIEKLK